MHKKFPDRFILFTVTGGTARVGRFGGKVTEMRLVIGGIIAVQGKRMLRMKVSEEFNWCSEGGHAGGWYEKGGQRKQRLLEEDVKGSDSLKKQKKLDQSFILYVFHTDRDTHYRVNAYSDDFFIKK